MSSHIKPMMSLKLCKLKKKMLFNALDGYENNIDKALY